MVEIKFSEQVNENHNIVVKAIYSDALEKQQQLMPILKSRRFAAKREECEIITDGEVNYIILGLGDANTLGELDCQKIGAIIYQKTKIFNATTIVVDIDLSLSCLVNLAFGIKLRSYTFNKYKSDAQNKKLDIIFKYKTPLDVEKAYARFSSLIDGMFFAKNLGSEPANVIYPKSFADSCLQLSSLGIVVEVLNQAQLKDLGMNALLSVSSGSSKEPFVVVLKWNGNKEITNSIALVGKGVCFDSGGINIKPSNSILHKMRYDMTAGAAVVGTLIAIAKQNLKTNVVGVIGLVENMPDGNATHPGDVVTSMSGKTIEIMNTDAEGRLVLADCMWYTATHLKPQTIIDLGTLTPEVIACLADEFAALYTENESLAKELMHAGKLSGEQLWQLPLGEAFKKQNESTIADLKNIGNEGAGECGAAAEFLHNFTNGIPWAHLDIAGMAWVDKETTLHEEGVTGYGVRLLESFIKNRLS